MINCYGHKSNKVSLYCSSAPRNIVDVMMTSPTKPDRSRGRVPPHGDVDSTLGGVRLAVPNVSGRAPQAWPLDGETMGSSEIALREGELWVAHHDLSHALHLRCVSGYVWITQEGRAEDTVVGAGGLCVVPGEGKAIVQALEDAVIRVDC